MRSHCLSHLPRTLSPTTIQPSDPSLPSLQRWDTSQGNHGKREIESAYVSIFIVFILLFELECIGELQGSKCFVLFFNSQPLGLLTHRYVYVVFQELFLHRLLQKNGVSFLVLSRGFLQLIFLIVVCTCQSSSSFLCAQHLSSLLAVSEKSFFCELIILAQGAHMYPFLDSTWKRHHILLGAPCPSFFTCYDYLYLRAVPERDLVSSFLMAD